MDFKTLARLRRHLEIKHHVPGRIRIKFSLAIVADPMVKKMANSGQDLPPGVKSARLNALARSVVIEYDADKFPPELLEELISTKDNGRAEEILVQLDEIIRS